MSKDHGYAKRRLRKDRYKKRGESTREICPICNRPLKAVVTAIVHRETGRRAHFDCIIKELKKFYCLDSNDSICYLGGGAFGIIEMDKSGKGDFVVKKRIQYEERK